MDAEACECRANAPPSVSCVLFVQLARLALGLAHDPNEIRGARLCADDPQIDGVVGAVLALVLFHEAFHILAKK